MPGLDFVGSAGYSDDPRGISRAQEALVVAPADAGEVSAIVRLCHEHSVAVIPLGGGTGLAGGQIPEGLPRPLVLSLRRMNRIREISTGSGTLTVEAGCVLQDVQAAAEASDRLFPLSLAAQGSCQIGGNLATNAGGVHVLRYGNARDLCLGLEVVLPDGEVWTGLSNLRKDNAGYDLRNLFIGSEGTLGIITAASLKLFHRPAEVATALLAAESPRDALSLLEFLRGRFGMMISAFEIISRVGFDFQEELDPDFRWPMTSRPDWMVLVDISSDVPGEIADDLVNAAGEAMSKSLVQDGVFPASERQRQELWRLREAIPEANRLIGSVSSHDLSVPIGSVADFLDHAVRAVAQIGDYRVNCFGHLGDGNLHFNVFPPSGGLAGPGDSARREIRDAVRQVVHRFKGSMFAEHGTGRHFVPEFLATANPVHLRMMRQVKHALDPKGIMNPGAVLPA